MRIFVTGGAGFIGFHLCQFLLDQGHIVTIYDYLDPKVVNPKALAWTQHPRCHLVVADVLDQKKLIDSIKHQDIVIHAAAQTSVDFSIIEPRTTFTINALGTVNVLEAMKQVGLKRIHYISTDAVFDDTLLKPFSETTTLRPRNSYAAGKASGEAAVFAWANTEKLEITVTNCCNNYGFRQAPDKLIPRLAIRGVLNKKLPIYGDGKQTREWLHVTDHVSAIWYVIQHGEIGHRYCIGGTPMQNIDIAQSILEVLQLDVSQIEHIVDRIGHDNYYAASTIKISELGWKPLVQLTDGLRDAIEWYRDNREWWEYFLEQREI